MFVPNIPTGYSSFEEAQTMQHVRVYANEFRDTSSTVLRKLILDYNKNHGSDHFPGFRRAMFKGLEDSPMEEAKRIKAAIMVLQERHGLDYILEMQGLRKPETLIEKARFFFNRKFVPV